MWRYQGDEANRYGETSKFKPSGMDDTTEAATTGVGGVKLYNIYVGTVQRVLDFGVVVEMNAPRITGLMTSSDSCSGGKISGMVHLSHVSRMRIEKPRDVNIRPGQRVYVKLISIGTRGVAGGAGEGGLMLSMKDVDQESGRDLMPHRTMAATAASASFGGGSNARNGNVVENAAASTPAAVVHPGLDVVALKRRQEEEEGNNMTHRQMQGGRSDMRGGGGYGNTSVGGGSGGGLCRKQQLTEQELFKAQQLIQSGVLPVEQYPTFDNEGGLGMLAQENT